MQYGSSIESDEENDVPNGGFPPLYPSKNIEIFTKPSKKKVSSFISIKNIIKSKIEKANKF